jgi:hypothetical protein
LEKSRQYCRMKAVHATRDQLPTFERICPFFVGQVREKRKTDPLRHGARDIPHEPPTDWDRRSHPCTQQWCQILRQFSSERSS